VSFVIPSFRKHESLEIQENISNQLNQIDYFISEFILSTEQDVNLLLQNEVFYTNNDEDFTTYINAAEEGVHFNPTDEEQKIIKIFDDYHRAKPQIEYAYMGRENGAFVMNQPLISESDSEVAFNFDPRNRPWYIEAKENPKEVVLAEPYNGPRADEFFLTASSAIVDENDVFKGVLGIDLNLNVLSNYLQTVYMGNYGTFGMIQDQTAIIIDEDGAIQLVELSSLHTRIISKITEMIEYETSVIDHEGKKFYLVFKKATDVNWIYYCIIPQEDIAVEINNSIMPFLLTSGVLTMVILLVVLLLIQGLVIRPLIRLSETATYISETGDLSVQVLLKNNDEFGNVASSFNKMVKEIKENRDNLEKQVEFRTKELKKLSVAVEQSPSSILITDNKGSIEFINQKLLETMGYAEKELIGKNPRIFKSGKHGEKVYQELWSTIKSGETWNGELINRKKDGSLIWERCLIAPVYSDSHEIVNYISIRNDVTEQKRAEEELVKAKHEAEIATKTKSEFLANMSHEIRTPMNAIIGLNSLLEGTQLNFKQMDYVTKIGKSAKNLLGIINDILDFSKIEAGKLALEEIEFNINDVMENVSSIVGMKAFEKGVELIIHKDSDVPNMLIGDPLRLGQIILNLTNNAVKFTERGEVVIKISTESVSIDQTKLKFEVKDTGIGMDEIQKSNLFKAFSQADSSITRKFGGTGLGLTITNNLINLMGGTIDVESQYGVGSNFTFILGFGIGISNAKRKINVPEALKHTVVVVVDDNEAARKVMECYLKSLSIKALIFKSSDEVIDYIESDGKFDLLITDYKMDKMDGIELWSEIKKIIPEDQLPKVIMVTAFGRSNVIEDAEAVGIENVLMKPISQSLLFDCIIAASGLEGNDLSIGTRKSLMKNINAVKGAKILLVEDNEINQQVAKESLENNSFWVDIASNGLEAVEMVFSKEKTYDLVLMDLQMPVMDGYSASAEIRKTMTKEELPIIALTADAMAGVYEKVKEAGMQGHVSKPIELKALSKELAKWIKPGEREINQRNTMKIVDELEVASVIDLLKSFDVVQGLYRMSDDLDEYKIVLRKFKENNEKFADELHELIYAGQYVEAQKLLHSLKGVSGNLGAIKIYELSKLLEEKLKNPGNQNQGILESVEVIKLHEELENAFAEIEELPIATTASQKDVAEMSEIEFTEALNHLGSLLEVFDASAEDNIKPLKRNFDNLGYSDYYVNLELAITDFDFDKALDLWKEIIAIIEK